MDGGGEGLQKPWSMLTVRFLLNGRWRWEERSSTRSQILFDRVSGARAQERTAPFRANGSSCDRILIPFKRPSRWLGALLCGECQQRGSLSARVVTLSVPIYSRGGERGWETRTQQLLRLKRCSPETRIDSRR